LPQSQAQGSNQNSADENSVTPLLSIKSAKIGGITVIMKVTPC